MPLSNTLTPTWRTARSRAPLPQLAVSLFSLSLSHHPPNTHFECCMNLVGGPCPLRSPDTSTSYRVNVCAVFPGPGTTQLWLFSGGRARHSPSSWFPLGSGDLVWDEEDIPSTSLCLSGLQQGCLQEEVSRSGEGEEGVSRALGAPSQMSVLHGLHSSRKDLLIGSQSLPCTPMPALLSHDRPAWGSWNWGRGHLVSC